MTKTKRGKKRNKKFSRKNIHKGGGPSDDFILIGFEEYDAPYRNPVFLPINCNFTEPNFRSALYITPVPDEIPDIRGAKYGLFGPQYPPVQGLGILILPQLYKLKNIRNIDLWDDLIGKGIGRIWNENNGDIVLVGRRHLDGSFGEKERYYNFFKNAIIKIELEYPGLFKPIFIDTALTKDEMQNLTSDQKLDIEDKANAKIYKK